MGGKKTQWIVTNCISWTIPFTCKSGNTKKDKKPEKPNENSFNTATNQLLID